MECKVSPTQTDSKPGDGFNRDIVECKDLFMKHSVKVQYGFNRDIVECKGY